MPECSRIFLTGGTGFFGKWLLKKMVLMDAQQRFNCKVVILSRNPDKFKRHHPEFSNLAWLSFIKGDIRNFGFPTGDFTHIIHAATDTSEASKLDPLGWFDQMVGGTRRVLEFAVSCGAKRFLLTSSGAVYGAQPESVGHIPEAYLGAPETSDINSVYGQAKRAAEQLCTIYHDQYGLETVVARCFAFVGEYLPLEGHFAIGNFIHDALHHDVIRVKGDGSPVRSYLYGEDLAVWLLTILDKGKAGSIYNVGSDQEICISDLAALVGRVLAPEKAIEIERLRPDYAGRSRYVPNIELARKELNLDVWTSLEEAVLKASMHERNGKGSVVS